MPLQGLMSFPGVLDAISGSFTFSRGISPSVAILSIPPQQAFIAQMGTLAISFGSHLIEFPDSIVDSSSIQITEGGHTVLLRILDRRWKWRYGEISGWYNRRLADGSIDPDSEKKPRELAELLLDAMGENDRDVKDLPNDSRPEVNWLYANPANELAALCDLLDCDVVLQLDNSVALRLNGAGELLPEIQELRNVSFGLDPPEIPDEIKLVGRKVFQSRLRLRAVGEDTDGSIKPIDDLSYKPAEGWSREVFGGFENVEVEFGEQSHKLAAKSVLRWYQIYEQCDMTLEVPGLTEENGDPIEAERWQIVPINEHLLEKYDDTQGSKTERKPKPAIVRGVYFKEDDSNDNTPANTEIDREFRVLRDDGIVEFSKPVIKRNREEDLSSSSDTTDEVSWAEADLDLETSYSVLNATTRQPYRYERTLETDGDLDTKPHILRHDEIIETIRAEYDAACNVTGTVTNTTDADEKADRILDQALASFQRSNATEAEYAGILPLELDGARSQITWSVGASGAITRIGRNTEVDYATPSHRARRRREEEDQQMRKARGRGERGLEVALDEARQRGA